MILNLLKEVFDYKTKDYVTILYDLLDNGDKNYVFRTNLAKKWYQELQNEKILCDLVSYRATCANNADLPETCFISGLEKPIDEVLSKTNIVIALTEFSATAPLHRFSKKFGLRIASMPGFNEKMIPALKVDYNDVAKKTALLKELFLRAENAKIVFEVDGREYVLELDFSTRTPLVDDGNCRKSGVINLPSGETFIAPLENGETNGYLPIQEGNEVVIYDVKKNNIVNANKDTELLRKIKQDSAVGNIAELAFGVLGLYKIKSCGKILLDEKLGLHIALGRSDHFGGLTGPNEFKKKENVWHQDFVYIKEMQPLISIKEAKLGDKAVIKDDKYVIF